MTKRSYKSCTRVITWLALATGPFGTASVLANSPGDSLEVVSPPSVDQPLPVPPDTLLFRPIRDVSPAAEVTNPTNLEAHLLQHPTTALFKSMLVPGLGQLGNRSYIKAVFFAGLESWFVSSSLKYASQASDARDDYLQAEDTGVRRNLYYVYDEKRKSRNKYAWFAGLTIFVSMFDAYVDAHLSGSPANPRNNDISLDLGPADRGGVLAQLTYHF